VQRRDLTGTVTTTAALPVDAGRPVALAGAGAENVLLERQRSLFLRRLSGNFVVATVSQPLMVSPAPQKSPSVVWSDADRAFLVAWDERGPSGSFAPRLALVDASGTTTAFPALANAPGLSGGLRPRLLRRPDGTGLAMHHEVDGGSQVSALDRFPGGFALGPPLSGGPLPGHPFSSLGVNTVVQWEDRPTRTPSPDVFVNGLATGLIGPITSTAAFNAGVHWLATLGSVRGLLFQGIPDVPNGVPVAGPTLMTDVIGRVALTVAPATSPGLSPDIVAAFLTDAGVEVWNLSPSASTVTPQPTLSRHTSEPLLAAITEGLLVISATPAGLTATALTGAGTQAVNLGATGLDVTSLSVASSPFGQAAVVWQDFDVSPDGGAVRVSVRLVGTQVNSSPDGGNTDGGNTDGGNTDGGNTDGGNTDGGNTDGGNTDGGNTDGGNTDGGNTDGGKSDAGGEDAGALDSGVGPGDAGGVDDGGLGGDPPDAGRPDTGDLTFVVVPCSCQPSGGLLPALMGLLLLSGRRRRAGA
jgi:hypothetical protein